MNMTYTEQTLCMELGEDQMIGIVSLPTQQAAKTGILIVVGGPQYRVGSHRQFVLLSRALASAGYACMRFDYRGMGDSSGPMRNFEEVREDIEWALTQFMAAVPSLEKVVLWGLCDAASANCFYAYRFDKRLQGLILLNPWVRTEAGEARTYLRNYYAKRILQLSFWTKLLGGHLNPITSVRSIYAMVRKLKTDPDRNVQKDDFMTKSLPERVLLGLSQHALPVLILLSGRDYVAAEFEGVIAQSSIWKQALQSSKIHVERVVDANHTFSSQQWRQGVEQSCIAWLCEL